jgi:hypothetical protein
MESLEPIPDAFTPQNLGQGWPWPSTVIAGVPTL